MSPSLRNQIAVTAVAFVGFTGYTLVMPFLALYVRALGVSRDSDVALWTGLVVGHSFRVVFVTAAITLAALAIAVRRVMVERAPTVEQTPVLED